MSELLLEENPVKTIIDGQSPMPGDLFYGNTVEWGLVEVLKCFMQAILPGTDISKIKATSSLLWYEKTFKTDDGDFVTVCYPTHEGPSNPLPDRFYPTVVFNATQDKLNSLDFMPDWKRFPVYDDNKSKIYHNGALIISHYYVIINTAHVPKPTLDGRSNDDGTYVFGDFIKGEQILNRFNAVKELKQTPIGMQRLRVGDV